jgi:hypothetical protein
VASGAAHTDNIQVQGLRKTYRRPGSPAQVCVKSSYLILSQSCRFGN